MKPNLLESIKKAHRELSDCTEVNMVWDESWPFCPVCGAIPIMEERTDYDSGMVEEVKIVYHKDPDIKH